MLVFKGWRWRSNHQPSFTVIHSSNISLILNFVQKNMFFFQTELEISVIERDDILNTDNFLKPYKHIFSIRLVPARGSTVMTIFLWRLPSLSRNPTGGPCLQNMPVHFWEYITQRFYLELLVENVWSKTNNWGCYSAAKTMSQVKILWSQTSVCVSDVT